jgi:pimeloyl-ACP methyl ester carboxylesterase
MPEGSECARRLLFERPSQFDSREDARASLERTSPGYSDAVYRNRLEFAFRDDEGELMWRSDAHALSAILRARADPEVRWEMLAAIRCPTLVVRGTRSNALSEELAERMVRALPDGRLVELDAGHNVALERPRELANAVVALAIGRSVR